MKNSNLILDKFNRFQYWIGKCLEYTKILGALYVQERHEDFDTLVAVMR